MSVRIAILGSGQLARMMALDGIPMGMQFCFLAEAKEDTRCVDGLGDIVVRQHEWSASDIFTALGEPQVFTVEKEHVDIALLESLSEYCLVHPNPQALAKFKNRHTEKRFLQSLNIPIAPFLPVRTHDDLVAALGKLPSPVFLKTEEEGYDGYNQFKIDDQNSAEVIKDIEFPGAWVAEAFVPFEREISFLAARGIDGHIVFYPAAENLHRNGTLLTSLVPAPNLSEQQLATGQSYIRKILEAVNYVGTICMECFIDQGNILVNEIAPRVHNSGHWTSKGAQTSQFENHVRAVAGLALGATDTRGISGMLNLLGVTLTAEQALGANTYLALYGKVPRPRRKLGHVTVLGDDYNEVNSQLQALRKLAYPE